VSRADLSKFTIQAGDHFMILGCDGLWTVFTPEGAIKFVAEALKVVSLLRTRAHPFERILSVFALQDCQKERTKYGAVKHKSPEEQSAADARTACAKLVEEAALVSAASGR
jgi:hypothetical protein